MPNNKILKRLIPALFVLLNASDAFSASDVIPKDFNPQTCEQDRLLKKDISSYMEYSCAFLRETYKWDPLQTAILDASNNVGNLNLSNTSDVAKFNSAIYAFSQAAKRLRNDFIKP